MQVYVMRFVCWTAALAGLAASFRTEAQHRTTIAETARNVAAVCRKFVERDNMDVRTLEDGLERQGADFKEITDIRLMCEVYALGRRDQFQLDKAPARKD